MKLHWISPYRTDKDIGRAINEAVRQLNADSDDWICLTDHDTLFLLPESKAHIESVLSGANYGLLGCLTNRIGSPEQLWKGVFNENGSILSHIGIAQECWRNYGGVILPAQGPIAAFMMCFQQKTFDEIGGFVMGALNFDSIFTRQARKLGIKTGVMQGVYVWHTYRLGSLNPRKEINHLLNK